MATGVVLIFSQLNFRNKLRCRIITNCCILSQLLYMMILFETSIL